MVRILHGLRQESKTGLGKEEGTIDRQLQGQALTNAIAFTDTFGAHRIPQQIVFQISFH